MKPRNRLIGVSLIGVVVALEFCAPPSVVAAGYRESGFVPWHRPEIRAAAATESGIGVEPDAPKRHLGSRGGSRICPTTAFDYAGPATQQTGAVCSENW
jgi:hypothetical protein